VAVFNASLVAGYVAACAPAGIVFEQLTIETEGELDLRGSLGLGGKQGLHTPASTVLPTLALSPWRQLHRFPLETDLESSAVLPPFSFPPGQAASLAALSP